MKNVFLDRDGVINRNPPNKGYVRTCAAFAFIPNALQAIRTLTESSYRIIVVTNQAGIGRGIFTEQNLMEIHHRMVTEIARAGGQIDAVYYCPHHPDAGCECRKPKPGMFIQAAREHDIDMSQAYVIGDSITDIEAARRAGASPILVLTGHGRDTYRGYICSAPTATTRKPDKIFTDLDAAARWLTLPHKPLTRFNL